MLQLYQVLPCEDLVVRRSEASSHDAGILSNSSFVRLCGKVNKHGQTDGAKAIRKRDNALLRLICAWEGACIACGRGDIPLDARLTRRRERVATRFDSRSIVVRCTKENRSKGGNLQKFSLAISTGTLQQLVELSSQP